jgi:hypothetical protein
MATRMLRVGCGGGGAGVSTNFLLAENAASILLISR